MSSTVIIIQARLGATRLPGKTLADIAEKPLIDWVIKSVGEIGNFKIIVATTSLPEDNKLVAHLEKRGTNIFRGDSKDVLSRYYSAAVLSNAETVIRICADSPLIAVAHMKKMLAKHLSQKADLTHVTGTSLLGPFGEIISASALGTIKMEVKENYQKEHVTPFIHEDSGGRFRVCTLEADDPLKKDYRLTIDTGEDLAMMRTLFEKIMETGKKINLLNALAALELNPKIAAINKNVKQKGWKE